MGRVQRDTRRNAKIVRRPKILLNLRLRPYQNKSVEAIFEAWLKSVATLLVLPTGCGKTQVFTEVIHRVHPKKSIVIAHREELITQARARIEQMTGLKCEVEMGNIKASDTLWNKADVIIATVQTLNSSDRLKKFRPEDFGLLVIDEAHRGTCCTYRKVVDHFRQNPELRVLGVTATPDRLDEQALGQVFESVAFEYDLPTAIDDGWLVPVVQNYVHIQGLDYSKCRTTAGDLNQGDLAKVMEEEETIQGIAAATLATIGAKRTIVFAVTVLQAEALSNIFNRHLPGGSGWICGKTAKDERRELLARFDAGKIQIMVNVGCLTEGYDSPGIECVVMASSTKSRAKYCQQLGRGTRSLPGIVDAFDLAEDRKLAISSSSKPVCTVLDFVGNSGKHKLIGAADVLGGKYSDEIIAKAKKKCDGKPMGQILAEVEQETVAEAKARAESEEARRKNIVATAQFSLTQISPFDMFNIRPDSRQDDGRRLSPAQAGVLERAGIDVSRMGYFQQKQLLVEVFARRDNNLSTFKQSKTLARYGYDAQKMTFDTASALITEIKNNGWKRVA